ncbi:MAG: transketolase [Magnetococcales bacterium]|nr:transketolase [Magnetococcales bacterium]
MRKTCLNAVHTLAKQDPRVLFIGSDLGAGTLDAFKAEFPERFFMEGVSEQNVIGMAAGLAMEGFIPYVNTIATFLTRRCYEQVAIDLCLHNLPVRLIGNGGGLVYAPLGPTHIAIEDMALMRALPNMTVLAPADAHEMARLMTQTLDWPGPIYIRLAKGNDPIVSRPEDPCVIGQGTLLRQWGQVALMACGVMVHRALQVADILAEEGIVCSVLNLHTVKPLDKTAVLFLTAQAKMVVTLEEHSRIGGLGSAVTDAINHGMRANHPPILRFALPDAFTETYGSQNAQLQALDLTPEAMAQRIRLSMPE